MTKRRKHKTASAPAPERRINSSGSVRAISRGDKRTIFGYATKFAPAMSEDLGGFREQIDSHAFDDFLAKKDTRVVGLWNHDTNHVLGATDSGTMRLSVDKVGLLYEIDAPDTTVANDLLKLIERGDVHSSSFGFYCSEDSWSNMPDGTPLRTVLKAELFDCSPVTFPAYPDATVDARAALRNAPADVRAKLKRSDDDDDDDDYIDCDDPENEDDPSCADGDNDDDGECSCRCAPCRDNDPTSGIYYCYRCENRECDSPGCLRCPSQRSRSKAIPDSSDFETTAAAALLARRLRS